MHCAIEEGTTLLGRIQPKLPVWCLIVVQTHRPPPPKFIECREVLQGVRVGGRTKVGGENRMFEHSIKHVRHAVHLSLGIVVVNAGPISPAVRHKEQSRHKILLPISGRRFAQFCPRGVTCYVTVPDKVVGPFGCAAVLHVGLRPVPKRIDIELRLLVHLYSDHHPV